MTKRKRKLDGVGASRGVGALRDVLVASLADEETRKSREAADEDDLVAAY